MEMQKISKSQNNNGFMIGWGGKVGVSVKAKCDKVYKLSELIMSSDLCVPTKRL